MNPTSFFKSTSVLFRPPPLSLYIFMLLFLYPVSVALLTPAEIPQWWHLLEGESLRIAENHFWCRNYKFWEFQCAKKNNDFWHFGNVPCGQVKMMENNWTTCTVIWSLAVNIWAWLNHKEQNLCNNTMAIRPANFQSFNFSRCYAPFFFFQHRWERDFRKTDNEKHWICEGQLA